MSRTWLRTVAAFLACGAAWAAETPELASLESKAFREAMERILPCVVTIQTHGSAALPSGGMGRATAGRDVGPTTGLVISTNGLIVTSTFNFQHRPEIISVRLANGTQHIAERLGLDDQRKICLLKIQADPSLREPEMAPREQLRVGQWAMAVGMGFGGEKPTLSRGIVSALKRIAGRAVQTDAKLSPANYGGPLVDLSGRVIGICVPLVPAAANARGEDWYDSGIGFAVPLAENRKLIASLAEGERFEPGRLGVSLGNMPHPTGGMPVIWVRVGSAAEKAGLRAGDIITAVRKDPVKKMADILKTLDLHRAGDTVEVTVRRGKDEKTFSVTLEGKTEN